MATTVTYINRLHQFGKVSYDALVFDNDIQVNRVPVQIPEDSDTDNGRDAISERLIYAYLNPEPPPQAEE